MKIKSKHFLFLSGIVLFFSPINLHSQGSWDIGYLPQQHIDESLIGQEVRIDFKSSRSDKQKRKRVSAINIRNLLIPQDTIQAELCGSFAKLVEQWTIYVDHGALQEQYLRIIDHDKGQERIIKALIVKEIMEESIGFEASLYGGDGSFLQKCPISIPRKQIKGLLISTTYQGIDKAYRANPGSGD